MAAACIFCKIIKGTVNSHKLQATPEKQRVANTTTNHTGEIPSMKLFESEKVFAFLDINPLSYGHAVRLLPLPAFIPTNHPSNTHTTIARHPQIPRRKTPRYPRRPTHRNPPRGKEDRPGCGCGQLQHLAEQWKDCASGGGSCAFPHDP